MRARRKAAGARRRDQGPPPFPKNSAIAAAFTSSEREELARYFVPRSVGAGAVVVREGARDRSMYVVEQGRADLRRDLVHLGELGPGDHFGELALVAVRRRAATIVAKEPMRLWVLERSRYEQLSRDQPALAVRLLEAAINSLAKRLIEATDNMGLLLRERSLPRRMRVAVTLGDRVVSVPNGTRVDALLPREIDGRRVVGAIVDHKLASLVTRVSGESTIEPLTDAHWEGRRVLRSSLALLALEAAERLEPPARLAIGQSLGLADRIIVVDAGGRSLPELASALGAAMTRLRRDDVELREELWTVEEAREHFSSRGSTSDAARYLDFWRGDAVPLVSYGTIYALRRGPLLPRTRAIPRFHLVADDRGLLLGPRAWLTGDHLDPEERLRSLARHAAKMTSAQETWLTALGVTASGAFNQACINGQVSQMIRVSEGFQEKSIGHIADTIAGLTASQRIVSIAGPSSSGKTTFIKRLRVQLQVNGLSPIDLSLDDYYVDRERTPRDDKGELDFEAYDALQADLLGSNLQALLAGERVRTPRYDFTAGKSFAAEGKEVSLGPRDVLLLEGLHGLNPLLFAAIPGARVFRIFVCPLVQLRFDHAAVVHPSDLRLIRRIVRDRHNRGYNAEATILRWPSVRAGERRHVFPHQDQADAVFDSSLVYELSVLKVFAERYLLEVPQHGPAYPTAYRLLELLDGFVSIHPEHVPPTSIVREFIGGSGFEY